jgi:molecular chaperone DnaJ
MDPYQVLGVSKSASEDDIKKAFRQLAIETHPDKNPGDKEAEDKFKEINAAYEILSNPQKRAAHDNPPRGFNPFEAFGDFFKANGVGGFSFSFGNDLRRPPPQHGAQEGEQIAHAIRISPFDILLNTVAKVNYQRKVHCPKCNGHGSDLVQCSTCKGAGFISEVFEAGRQKVRRDSPCPTCYGRGYEQTNKCGDCGGAGLVVTDATEDVPLGNVERGYVFMPGKGHYGPFEGPPGALVLEIHVWYPPQELITDEAKDHLKMAADLIKKAGETNDPKV